MRCLLTERGGDNEAPEKHARSAVCCGGCFGFGAGTGKWIYDDGEQMIFIHMFSLAAAGNKVVFFRTDSFREPQELEEINDEIKAQFRSIYSFQIVDVVEKTVQITEAGFFKGEAPRDNELIWSARTTDEAPSKINMNKPTAYVVYLFCRELLKEQRISGQMPGLVWVD